MVPAAGLSRRMGRPKVLLPFGDTPMLVRVVETILEAGVSPVVVVTGHGRESVESALAGLPVECVFNADYEHGEMLSSVQAGVRAVAARADSMLLALADQPGVEAATIRALVSTWSESEATVVVPLYDGKRGHPVVISSALFPELLELGENETLKTLMLRYQSSTRAVDLPDPAVVADVDTPADYERALRTT